jgi:hypothetical protein
MAAKDQIVQLAIAYSTQNITEIQVNNGWTDPNYQADMVSIGWSPGDEWCAASVKLTWKKGYVGYPNVWAHAQNLISLNSQQMARNFHADPVWPTSTSVAALGAIAVWQEGNSSLQGHCGIVVAINGNQFTTVEGNTSSPNFPSIRNGWTVAQHTHTLGQPHSNLGLNFERFVYAIESYAPLVP